MAHACEHLMRSAIPPAGWDADDEMCYAGAYGAHGFRPKDPYFTEVRLYSSMLWLRTWCLNSANSFLLPSRAMQ